MCSNRPIGFFEALAFAPRMLLASLADGRADRRHRKENIKRYTETCQRFPGPTVTHDEYEALHQAMGMAFAAGEGNGRQMPLPNGDVAVATFLVKDPDIWALAIMSNGKRVKDWLMMPSLMGGRPMTQIGQGQQSIPAAKTRHLRVVA